jgi:hypothetical protein
MDEPTEDTRRKIDTQEAVTRGTLWEQMGCPQSKLFMAHSEYMRSFRGRYWFASKAVLTEAQMALRMIFCPKCYKEVNFGIEATQFFTRVEDDVMTVFPAVGHFVCHWCSFEEWHPLKHDPRLAAEGLRAQQERFSAQQMLDQARSGMNQYAGHSIGHAGYANIIGQGIQSGMGPIQGMTNDERQSLHRLYQQTKSATCPPPKIVESREEAELLLKLAPVERRQAIIQKLRDLGKL